MMPYSPLKILSTLLPAWGLFVALSVQATPLNDTGIIYSGDTTSSNATTCDPAHPAGQDCNYGRDAEAADGALIKVGASAHPTNGFDFTKISNTGQTLSASAALGNGSNDWACTRDNVTGLIWEIKTNDGGLRHMSHTYTWYDPVSPDSSSGDQGNTSTCADTLGGQGCNTANYVSAINAVGLCGYSDWRMPKIKELEGIADLGSDDLWVQVPSIDPVFFLNTLPSFYWSGTPVVYHLYNYRFYAWHVNFRGGYASHTFGERTNAFSVRLVRSGQ